ncbi:Innexin [Dirofilaria immitis]|nr:Innexin [Dirofilaria immitis]
MLGTRNVYGTNGTIYRKLLLVQNTYFLPLHDYIPHNYAERENRQIGYYQWVPFVLALEALLFYVPTIVWRLLNWQSGIHVQSLVQMACDSRLLDLDSRNKALQTIATNVEEALHVKHQVMGGNRLKLLNLIICTRSSGAAVTFLYISVKILYTVNIVGQIFLLNTFLGNRSKWYGLQVLNDLMNGREWEESGHFPRVTLCDFEVKVSIHFLQDHCCITNCANSYFSILRLGGEATEKSARQCSSAYSAMRSHDQHVQRENISLSMVLVFLISWQLNFVGKYLTGIEGYKMVDSQSLRRFVFHFLRQDGVFLLRMVATHAGELPCYELAKTLWNKYCDNKEGKMHDV